jgi:hypothetical protein
MSAFKNILDQQSLGERFAEKKTSKRTPAKKLKWMGKPEHLGFIFLELASKGYIELPSTKGDGSYSKYAQICFDMFEFSPATTLPNLKRAFNPNTNATTDAIRAKFQITDCKDIM